MAFFRRVKNTVKPFINVPRWIDAKSLIENGKHIADLAKRLFVPASAKKSETFEEAMLRLKLTEEDIQQRTKQFQMFAYIFIAAAIVLLSYSIYVLIAGTLPAFLGSLGLFFLILGQAFRYHFWTYQMRQRKLGCSLSEWFKNGLLSIRK